MCTCRETVNPLPYLITVHHVHSFTFKMTSDQPSSDPLRRKLLLGILQLKDQVRICWAQTRGVSDQVPGMGGQVTGVEW